MTIDIKQLEGLLERVTPGEWIYRPREDDYWGIVRVANGCNFSGYDLVCQAKDHRYLSDDYLSQCRSENRDPWEYNARLISLAPALARRVIAAEKLAEALGEMLSEYGAPYDSECRCKGDTELGMISEARKALSEWENMK